MQGLTELLNEVDALLAANGVLEWRHGPLFYPEWIDLSSCRRPSLNRFRTEHLKPIEEVEGAEE